MAFSAADLKMVDDHIALGKRHVRRQKELIAFLQSQGHPTAMAEELLEEFQATLDQHLAHRELMLLDMKVDGLRTNSLQPAGSRAPGSPKPD